jgi:hypothetical protein
MKIGQFRNVLKTAEKHYQDDGQGELASALSTFAANLLLNDDNATVASVVGKIKKARSAAGLKSSRRSSQNK